MVDRNLTVANRGGIYTSRGGMELHVPPSGFDFRSAGGPQVNIDPFTEDNASQQYPLGTKLVYGERWFRYVLAGAVALVSGNVLQSSVFTANHLTMAVDVPAAGAVTVTPTLGATAVTLNEYRDGFFIQDAGATGAGYLNKILSHPAADASAAVVLTLVDPIVVAIPAAGTASILRSPYSEPIQAVASTPTAKIMGVAQSVITAAQFGWVQTHGPASVLTAGTVLVQNPVTGTTGTAGACGPVTVADVLKETIIGFVLSVGASATWSTIDLTIE